jgi:K+-sensing histidine kinase KdpD
MSEPQNVSWDDLVRFLRQLSHDLRNHLNAAELQAVYLNELAENEELKTEVKRIREMIGQLGSALQKLSADVGPVKPNRMTYRTSDFAEDMEKKIANDFPKQAASVKWERKTDDSTFEIDPQLLQQAVLELFANAFRSNPGGSDLRAVAKIEQGRFIFELSEPKKEFALATENWGREPMRYLTQGHYGLGLRRVRAIIEAHGGEFRARYDASTLVTTMALPLAGKSGKSG